MTGLTETSIAGSASPLLARGEWTRIVSALRIDLGLGGHDVVDTDALQRLIAKLRAALPSEWCL